MSAQFTPGKLSNGQRDLIMRAADGNGFLNSFDIGPHERAAFNGLLARDFFETDDTNLFRLTQNGEAVAVAVRKLRADRTGRVDPRDFLCPRQARGER